MPPRRDRAVPCCASQSGLLFGLPIVLDTSREDIKVGDKVLLNYEVSHHESWVCASGLWVFWVRLQRSETLNPNTLDPRPARVAAAGR